MSNEEIKTEIKVQEEIQYAARRRVIELEKMIAGNAHLSSGLTIGDVVWVTGHGKKEQGFYNGFEYKYGSEQACVFKIKKDGTRSLQMVNTYGATLSKL